MDTVYSPEDPKIAGLPSWIGRSITEVLAMRRFLFLLALVLAACGGSSNDSNNGSGNGSVPPPAPVLHAPEISNLVISPDSAFYMEGDGSVPVTVEFSFNDPGRDVATLRVELSYGTSLTIPLAGLAGLESGTVAEQFDVTTADATVRTAEIWLVDEAGQSSNHLSAAFAVTQHVPEISSVTLNPGSAVYMESGGSIVVTADVAFRDVALDIQDLWVMMPDGTTTAFQESFDTETGTFAEELNFSTETIGTMSVEFWLLDAAGNSSQHHTAQFTVIADTPSSDWTSRLSDLPYVLHDVIWDGSVFVAVGGGGAVLTSVDGIDWVERDSGTNSYLSAVAVHGNDIFAVGFEAVLLSTDHGQSWELKHEPSYAMLGAVAVNSSQVVACGNQVDLFLPRVMVSEDRGDTWQEVSFSWGSFFGFFSDLIYKDNMFTAATSNFHSSGRAMMSIDGSEWTTVFYDDAAGLIAIVHDGSQYVVGGGNGTVFKSFDGSNWTKMQTPVADVDYLSAAWSGSRLLLAGGYSYRYYSRRIVPEFEVPVGVASTDGGVSWEIFNIDGSYESRGMAYGNGRFVSVGQTAPLSGVGAIYTTE